MVLNNRHRFCIEVVAVVLFTAVMIFVLELLFRDVPTRIDSLYADIHKSNDTIELAIVGNSHAGAMKKPSILGVVKEKVGNYSVSGQDLFHAKLIVDELIKSKKNLKYIILFVDYDMLGYNLIETNQRYTDREYYKYADTMQDMSFVNKMMAWSNFFRCNRDFSKMAKKIHADKINESSRQIKESEKFIPVATTNDTCFACEKRALEMTSIKFKSSLVEKNKVLLQKIINLVFQNNKTLIVVVPPKRQCFYEYANMVNTQMSKTELYKLMELNNRVIFIDLYENSDFCDDDFVDADHANQQGVEKIIINIEQQKKLSQNNEK